jgi:hypothetical protein
MLRRGGQRNGFNTSQLKPGTFLNNKNEIFEYDAYIVFVNMVHLASKAAGNLAAIESDLKWCRYDYAA